MKFCGSQPQHTKPTHPTYISRKVVEDIRLQRHIHINRPRNPAQLALSHIKDSVNAPGMLACDLASIERSQHIACAEWRGPKTLTLNPSHAPVATCSTAGFKRASRRKYMSSYCCW